MNKSELKARFKFNQEDYREVLSVLEPPPDLTVSQWAEKERYLSPEASAMGGKWKNDKTPYMIDIMNAVSDISCNEIVIQAGAQMGKTEFLLNVIGYFIQHDPRPMMLVNPTLDMVSTFSKTRLAPMLRDTPSLRDKVKDPRARDSGNTVYHKVFPGGTIYMSGSNSPASLSSRPVSVVLLDEVDRMPDSVGTEGSPIDLARARTITFWNRKIIQTSTPTIKNHSKIEAAFLKSDQSKYYIRCVDCNQEFEPLWDHVQWKKGETKGDHKPETARIVCPICNYKMDNIERLRAVSNGLWKKHAVSNVRGFKISGLCSPWTSLEHAVQWFLKSKKNKEQLRVFFNTYLAETFEELGESLTNIDFLMRREDYVFDERICVVVAGVDAQDDRLELEVLGFSEDQTFNLDYKVIHGSPGDKETWNKLDDELKAEYQDLQIQACGIDTGGHFTQQVYDYCKKREKRRVFALKGIGGEGKPIVGRPTKSNVQKVKLFQVGTNTVKDLLFECLKIEDKNANNYCHFPESRDEEYFAQLTAESRETRYHKGFKKHDYVKKRTRNEALDCRCYAIAAFHILNPNLHVISKKIQASRQAKGIEFDHRGQIKKSQQTKLAPSLPTESQEQPEQEQKPKTVRKKSVRNPRKSSFVKGW